MPSKTEFQNIFGHKFSIVAIGRNKIVKDLDEALYRIKKIIAPTYVCLRVDLSDRSTETPYVVTGQCNDCGSKNIRDMCGCPDLALGIHLFLTVNRA